MHEMSDNNNIVLLHFNPYNACLINLEFMNDLCTNLVAKTIK